VKVKNYLLGVDAKALQYPSGFDAFIHLIVNYPIFAARKTKKVYVLTFNGDVSASQVERLREEITAILTLSENRSPEKDNKKEKQKEKDEEGKEEEMKGEKEKGEERDKDRVVVVLNSGGGTVTGYGLAAAQLDRIKSAGLGLTVCVDQVAASGGYLMAAVAGWIAKPSPPLSHSHSLSLPLDEIVASPFALLGSIGVIATMPNFSERLQREGVSVEDVTAGRYKRTLTPYKKPTDADRLKLQDDINNVLVGTHCNVHCTLFPYLAFFLAVFKDYLKRNRPKMDVDQLATGETWYGPDALRLGLVDRLATSDDVSLIACTMAHLIHFNGM
jgi:hypothetical protein